MKFDISTLKRATCAVIATCVLLLGTLTTTQAQQRRYRRADNEYPNNEYGQQRDARNRRWREARHDIQRRQRYERYVIRDSWRNNRDDNGNNRAWRERRKSERTDLHRHQRDERQEFKERFKNRRRGR
jgi:hypothetical protein